MTSLYNNLESIQNIAKELNINIPAIKKLNTINTPNNIDLISLNSEKPRHEVNNRNTKTSAARSDDDVDIKTENSKHNIEKLSDVDVDLIGMEKKAKSSLRDVKNINIGDLSKIMEQNPETNSLNYITEAINEHKFAADKRTMCDFEETYSSDVDIIPIKKEKTDTTGYGLNSQSTSKSSHFISTSYGLQAEQLPSLRRACDYKYGYEDIITGTFDEKLDECLAKGVRINVKDKDSHDLSVAMLAEYKDILNREKYKQLMMFREKLPTYQKCKELLNIIKANQVVVISGETGCGKSTQVSMK